MRLLIPWWLAACGDGEPNEQTEIVDRDGDGVLPGADCDDTNEAIHPDADERCNAIDDDCDGAVDEDAVDAIALFADADADGYGDVEIGTSCAPAAAQTATAGDCDDAKPGVHPGALEICNDGVDDDCDGAADDADDDPSETTDFYADADGDGYGGGAPLPACEPVPGHSRTDGSDCDDTDAAVHPGAVEMCNGMDDDCDALTTETGLATAGGVPYWRIQQAVDAASAGTTVTICDGTFYENVRVDKDIVLEGRGPDHSIIDGDGAGAVVAVTALGVTLTVRGLTLQHGTGSAAGSDVGGGGVNAFLAQALLVADCVITENSAEIGGGVMGPPRGDVVVSGTVIRNNVASRNGGGAAFVSQPPDVVNVRDSEIVGNTSACSGGGLFISPNGGHSNGGASLQDTLIEDNVVEEATEDCTGGGLHAFADLALSGVTISNNVAYRGAGAFVEGSDATADEGTLVTGNTTYDGGSGGGVYIRQGQWRYGVIEGNEASRGGGIGLDLRGVLADATLQANRATTSGGGMWIAHPSANVHDTTIAWNESDGVGGGIGTEAYDSTSLALLLERVTITSNVAATAGGGARLEMNLQCDDCDWGSGATENSPDDISLYWEEAKEVTYDAFTGPEDFVCVVQESVCE
jgi:hypothetical protein